MRYDTNASADGLPPGEGAFFACTCWLADIYTLQQIRAECSALFERLLTVFNEAGLLAAECNARIMRMPGNSPAAFSHVEVINTMLELSRTVGPLPVPTLVTA